MLKILNFVYIKVGQNVNNNTTDTDWVNRLSSDSAFCHKDCYHAPGVRGMWIWETRGGFLRQDKKNWRRIAPLLLCVHCDNSPALQLSSVGCNYLPPPHPVISLLGGRLGQWTLAHTTIIRIYLPLVFTVKVPRLIWTRNSSSVQ